MTIFFARNRIKVQFRKLGASKLLRAGMGLTIANLATGALGYAFQVLMGRMLSPAEFALLSAILSLAMFCTSPLGAMYLVISRRVSALRAHSDQAAMLALYMSSGRFLALAGLICGAVLYLGAPRLQAYLRAPDMLHVTLFGLFLLISAFMLVNQAFFQGLQWFRWLGGSGAASALLKIVISVFLVAQGWGVIGALIGAFIAVTLVSLVGTWANIRWLRSHPMALASPAAEPIPFKTVIPVLVASLAFAAMTQLDMVLVNRYFSPEQAGQYAAASVLGKAILYLPGGLVMALFPMAAEGHAKNETSFYIFRQAALATVVLCGGAALFYTLFGEWLVHLLYGTTYAGAASLLQIYGWAILPMTLVMVAEYFLIAQGRVLFAWLFLLIAPVQVTIIHLWHDELWMVIAAMGGCGTLLMLLGYLLLKSDR